MIDSDSHTVQLCAAGMAVDGDPAMARAYFARAWDARGNDYDASIAAHFVARHQPTAEDRLHWNQLAVQHLAPDGYSAFVAEGLDRLRSRLAAIGVSSPDL